MSYKLDGAHNGDGICWPDGKRIAVMVTFDFDAELLRMSRAKRKGTKIGFSDYSRGQYGPCQGLERCLSMLEEHQISSTFFVPGHIIEIYRDSVVSIHEHGHEIAYHGYMHESDRGLSLEEERENMEKSEALIASITGYRPVGHRGPESIIHPYTTDLLLERNYLYGSSMKDCDFAYLHERDGQMLPLVELPNDITMDDFTYFYFTFSDPAVRAMYTNREVIGNWKAEFDGLAAEGDKIFILKLHPQMIGRGCRIKALSEFITYMKENGAWITTCRNVAEYVLSQKGGAAHELA